MTKSKYVIVGDINIDLLKFNLTANVTDYVNSIYSVGCNVCVNRPTRVTSHGSSCIDHVYSNIHYEDLNTNVLLSDVSDHFSTLTKIKGLVKVNNQSIYEDVFVRKSKLSEDEWIQLNQKLLNNLNSVFDPDLCQQHVNDYASGITEAYQNVINDFMPLHKLSRRKKKHPTQPWMTSGLIVSSDRKNLLFDKANSSKDVNDWNFYKKYLNIFTSVKKLAYYLHYREKASLYGNDKAKTWALINEISKRKRVQNKKIKSIKDKDGNLLQDPMKIANCLNEHFASIGKEMAAKFDEPSNENDLKDPLDYISYKINHSIFMHDTDEAEILSLISKLETKKACGYDQINNKIIK